jgi:capsular exopolysaccharide synthesis family protein
MSRIHSLLKNTSSQINQSPLVAAEPPSAEAGSFDSGLSRVSELSRVPVANAHILPQSRLVLHTDPGSTGADRFRVLRVRLKQMWPVGKPRVLLITSPLPHDGKSTVALNLASALCEQGKHKVLVIEADLHHICLAQQLRLPEGPGLTACLAEGADPIEMMRRVEPLQWYLLAGGRPIRNPTDALCTPTFPSILHTVAPMFDWVILDSPPVLPVTDALVLAQHASASLLVARAGVTPDEAVEQSIASLGASLLGVVLNGADHLDRLYSHYGYYQSDDGTKAARETE